MKLAGIEVVKSKQHIVKRSGIFRHPALRQGHPEHGDPLAGLDIAA